MMRTEIREPTFFAMTALADAPRHGYGIIQEVARLSRGQVHLKAGSLYATLDRRVEECRVSVVGEEVVDGRNRRYYRLTDRGCTALAAESYRRRSMSTEALRRLRVSGRLA
jgi:PadR family transcriptional regulator, regulatory protein PadR